jgi:hypothetical protein
MKRFLPSALLLTLALGAAACGNPNAPDDLDDAERTWNEQGITSYRLVFDRICFCLTDHAGRFEVMVIGGNVVSVIDPLTGRERVRSDEVAYTVPALFEVIEREHREGADEVDVEYHRELGYPLAIRIDRERQATDDELEITVLELSPLR